MSLSLGNENNCTISSAVSSCYGYGVCQHGQCVCNVGWTSKSILTIDVSCLNSTVILAILRAAILLLCLLFQVMECFNIHRCIIAKISERYELTATSYATKKSRRSVDNGGQPMMAMHSPKNNRRSTEAGEIKNPITDIPGPVAVSADNSKIDNRDNHHALSTIIPKSPSQRSSAVISTLSITTEIVDFKDEATRSRPSSPRLTGRTEASSRSIPIYSSIYWKTYYSLIYTNPRCALHTVFFVRTIFQILSLVLMLLAMVDYDKFKILNVLGVILFFGVFAGAGFYVVISSYKMNLRSASMKVSPSEIQRQLYIAYSIWTLFFLFYAAASIGLVVSLFDHSLTLSSVSIITFIRIWVISFGILILFIVSFMFYGFVTTYKYTSSALKSFSSKLAPKDLEKLKTLQLKSRAGSIIALVGSAPFLFVFVIVPLALPTLLEACDYFLVFFHAAILPITFFMTIEKRGQRK